jgi:hypothetical protein
MCFKFTKVLSHKKTLKVLKTFLILKTTAANNSIATMKDNLISY